MAELEALTRDAMMGIASELGVEKASTLRKQELVFKILEAQSEREGNVFRAGVLEIVDDGYGFLRRESFIASLSDVYVSQSQVRRFGVRTGDYVTGTVRPPKGDERYYSLLRVEAVNGVDPEVAKRRPYFEQLTAVFPDVLIDLETSSDNLSQRIINLVSPIGRGQRGLIVSPPKAGKTFLLTLAVTRILEQQSLDVSVWGSADGQQWGATPLIAFPQKFYQGVSQLLLDLRDAPETKFLRTKWTVNRWGVGSPKPRFSFLLKIQEQALAGVGR